MDGDFDTDQLVEDIFEDVDEEEEEAEVDVESLVTQEVVIAPDAPQAQDVVFGEGVTVHTFKPGDKVLEGKDRLSHPVMTTFERAALIAERARQLSQGVPTMLTPQEVHELMNDPNKQGEKWDPVSVAKRELELRKLPANIIRRTANPHVYERWKLSEFRIIKGEK